MRKQSVNVCDTVQESMGWSFFSEVAVKFVVPITNMILARVLTPDAFGVVAVCNMLISFVDLIADAGFGKYLVQHDFEGEYEKNQCANVSFWTNLLVSAVMVLLIVSFRFPIASLLGHREYGNVLAVASVQLIITSISGIQTALFRRNFDFKKLFIARIAVAAAPLFITVPLAIILRTFWGLVIGNIAGALVNAVVLSALSEWKPKMSYSFSVLREMFSYSFWSLCETLANWAIFWVDSFIVGNIFTEYQLGLYKNSTNMVQSVMGMASASISPVLLSVLSRLKNSEEEYKNTFLNIQNLILYLVIPMGVGLFLYRKTATLLLFGKHWGDAADIVGAWGLMMICSVAFYNIPAELYKSKGIPKILFLSQIIYLAVLIPVCIASAEYGFLPMVYSRCICVLWQVSVSIFFIKKYFKINLSQYFKTFDLPVMATLFMAVVSKSLGIFLHGTAGDIAAILLCILTYLCFLLFFAKEPIKNNVNMLKNE